MTVNPSGILLPIPARDDRALRLALESAKDYATFLLDPAGYVKTWNIGAQRIKGYAAYEIIGRHFSSFYTAEDRANEKPRRALEIARTVGFYQEEGLRVRKDGTTFDAAVTITALYDTSRKLIGYAKVTWDIGELRRREGALRDDQSRLAGIVQSTEEQLRLAVEATQLGTWELNPQTGVRHWSDRSRALFGIPPSAELTTDVIMARVHPDDRQRLVDVMRDVLRNEAHSELSVQFRLAGSEDLGERWIESRGRAFYTEGQAVRFFGTFLDITDRKRAETELRASEDRYRTLFEWAPDGILIADHRSYYIGANESICRMLGYRRDELVGLHASDIVASDEVENIGKALAAINAGADYHREWRFRRKDGSEFSAEVIATIMPDGNLLGMVRDISERKQAEAKINQLNAELEQRVVERTAQLEAANKELESFSYSVSHDLRAPLRGVHGFVSMLREKYSGKLDDEGNRWLGIVAGESKRMGRLIDDLLAFSRLGRENMKQTSVDMNGLAASVFEHLMIGTTRELSPRFVLQPLPAAHGDRSMLRQVFVNLIGNAVKFSRNQPSPAIEVGCSAGTETVYYVKDNGAGFDERYSHKLFGVFQRLHGEQEFEGTGVGLALVQRIIQRHNGRIWATGKLGEGATFYFTLASAKEGTS